MQFLTTIISLLSLSAAAFAAPTECKRDIDMAVPSSDLPGVPEGLKLKYILLGVGTQNYTCADGAASTVPKAIGAVAKLYDMSSVARDPNAETKIKCTPPVALGAYMMGQNILDGYLKVAGYSKVLGEHYFDAAGVPTFKLDSTREQFVLRAKKIAGVPAPNGASAGTPPNGAVDWLYLADNGSSVGLKGVYRVETAGGKSSATCEGKAGAQQVTYATEYWIYA